MRFGGARFGSTTGSFRQWLPLFNSWAMMRRLLGRLCLLMNELSGIEASPMPVIAFYQRWVETCRCSITKLNF